MQDVHMYSFLFADMAMLGQELMLCKADDLDLINVIILPIQVFRIGGKKKKKETCLILHQSFIIIPFHPCIQGNASFRRQLQFLQQLLSVVPACDKSCGARADAELLLNELFSAENQHLLSQMLQPSLEPWPSHMKYVY